MTSSTAQWVCPLCRQKFLRRNQSHSCNVQSVDAFFAKWPHARKLFDEIERIVRGFGHVEVAATNTQVSFRAATRFAWVHYPQTRYVLLAFDAPTRIESPRIQDAVPIRTGRWTHHVKVSSTDELDAQLVDWLRGAYERSLTRTRRGTRLP